MFQRFNLDDLDAAELALIATCENRLAAWYSTDANVGAIVGTMTQMHVRHGSLCLDIENGDTLVHSHVADDEVLILDVDGDGTLDVLRAIVEPVNRDGSLDLLASPCDDCNADAGESCRPHCLALAGVAIAKECPDCGAPDGESCDASCARLAETP